MLLSVAMNNIQQAVDIICEAIPDVNGIYLYGSFAKNQATAESDVDLAVLGPEKYDEQCLQVLSEKIARVLRRDVDLVDLRAVSTVFKMQIVSTSKRVYCADQYACDYFDMVTYVAYLHLQETRKEIIDSIIQRGSIY
jgi:predicted nucleotidyltransferase